MCLFNLGVSSENGYGPWQSIGDFLPMMDCRNEKPVPWVHQGPPPVGPPPDVQSDGSSQVPATRAPVDMNWTRHVQNVKDVEE